MGYAVGRKARGECDRCGTVVMLASLRREMVDGRLSNLRVCPSCFDIDNEQWQVRLLDMGENIALRDPRPEYVFPLPVAPIQWGADTDVWWGLFTPLRWGDD